MRPLSRLPDLLDAGFEYHETLTPDLARPLLSVLAVLAGMGLLAAWFGGV